MKSKFLTMAVATVFSAILANTSLAPPGIHPGSRIEKVAIYSGSVGALSYNHEYVWDGFCLQGDGQNVLIKFSPHLGSQIVPVLKKGIDVTVNGIFHYPHQGGQEIKSEGTTIRKNL